MTLVKYTVDTYSRAPNGSDSHTSSFTSMRGLVPGRLMPTDDGPVLPQFCVNGASRS